MTLPKIKHATFTISQPSSGKKLSFRPYTVKEEKILLMAQNDEAESAIEVVKQVINNCLITKGVNVDTLPLFDLEYFFMKLRAKSVNNMMEFTIVDKVDGEEYNLKLDLDQVEVNKPKDHTPKIVIDDSMGFVMRYPSMAELNVIKANENDNAVDAVFSIIAACVDKIYKDDEIFVAGTDFELPEAKDFLESLPSTVFQNVYNFFATVPQLEHTIKYKRKDGSEGSVTLKGMADFFT